jgi:hypothetical protein
MDPIRGLRRQSLTGPSTLMVDNITGRSVDRPVEDDADAAWHGQTNRPE